MNAKFCKAMTLLLGFVSILTVVSAYPVYYFDKNVGFYGCSPWFWGNMMYGFGTQSFFTLGIFYSIILFLISISILVFLILGIIWLIKKMYGHQ